MRNLAEAGVPRTPAASVSGKHPRRFVGWDRSDSPLESHKLSQPAADQVPYEGRLGPTRPRPAIYRIRLKIKPGGGPSVSKKRAVFDQPGEKRAAITAVHWRAVATDF